MIALNHSFVADVATSSPTESHAALALIEHVRRRMRALPLVHQELAMFDWGVGPLVQWANQMRRDPERRQLVELLLAMLSGPFIDRERFVGAVDPSMDDLADWLQDIVRMLLTAPPTSGAPHGLVSPAVAGGDWGTGGAGSPAFSGGDQIIANWREIAAFDQAVIAAAAGPNIIDILRQAEERMDGALVLLPSAVRSAEAWTLDCAPADLLRALLGLEAYAAALLEGHSREQCAERYRQHCGIEMFQETGAVRRQPTRRRQRELVAGPHGKQYFDMHAKPGNLTRVHVWVFTSDGAAPVVIYVGHCGRHLD